MVAKKLLANSTDLMDVAGVIQKFVHGVTVANPIKVSAPKPTPVVANGPATGTSFADKRVKKRFAVSAAARAQTNRAKMGASHQQVKHVVATCFKNGQGGEGGFVVGRLHQNVRHAKGGPVGFQKDWQGRIKAGEAGAAGDGDFERVEAVRKVRSPGISRDRFAMMRLGKHAKRSDLLLIVRDEPAIECDKTDKGG